MPMNKTQKLFLWFIAALFVLPLLSVFAADNRVGTADIDLCVGSWTVNSTAITATSYMTPDIANLQLDSGWIFFDDNYNDIDSGTMGVYDNLAKTPNDRLAHGDSSGTDQAGCIKHSIMFNQEAMPQNDSIWLACYTYFVPTSHRLKIANGIPVYYEFTPSGMDDPWDTDADSYDGTYGQSIVLFMSESGAPAAVGQVIIIGDIEAYWKCRELQEL